MEATYQFNREQAGEPSLSCRLRLDGSRFRLAVVAIAPEPGPNCAGRREEWDYAGEWSQRGSEFVFRPATCESRDWPELEVASVEVAMMDQPFFQAHASPGEFSARVLDAVRILLPVPREMAERGGFKYGEVVLTKE